MRHSPVLTVAIVAFLQLLLVQTPTGAEPEITGDDGEELLSRVRRVIGGQHITDGQWPWLVSLQAKIVTRKLFGFIPIAYTRLYCGGAVLNDNWILTAAHCFRNKDSKLETMSPRVWKARLAAVSLKAGFFDKVKHFFGKLFGRSDWLQWDRDVDRIVLHPSYDPANKWENDIALIRIRKGVPSGPDFSDIQRIRLPELNDNSFPAAGDRCVTKGWGCTSDGGGVSENAMAVQLTIQPTNNCNWRYGIVMDTRLCVGTEGRGICQGDSGGPLVCRKNGNWVQVGIASFVHARRPDFYPSVFTRVSSYVTWIKKTSGYR